MWELFPKSVITGLESKVGIGHSNEVWMDNKVGLSKYHHLVATSPGQLYEQAKPNMIFSAWS